MPAGLTYLAAGIAVFEATQDVGWVLVYALIIVTTVLIVVVTRLRSTNRSLLQQLREHSLTRRERLDQLTGGMVSLVLYLIHEPMHDTAHHFTEVTEEYVIHGDDGTYNWELRGSNASNEESVSLVVKLTGDSALGSRALDVSATDCSTGQRLTTVVRADEPFIKVLEVLFASPIRPGEPFHLRLSARWAKSFLRARRDDYVFFFLGQYATQGVDRLFGRLVSDVPVTNVELQMLLDDGMVLSTHQPRIPEYRAGRHIVEWSATDPKNLFLLQFHKHPPEDP